MKQPTVLAVALAISFGTKGQYNNDYDPSRKIPKDALIEDLLILERSLDATHTGLYSYTDKRTFTNNYRRLRNGCDDMTEREFLKYVGPLVDLVKNGHTEISTSEAHWNFVKMNHQVFPLELRLTEDQAFVTKNHSKSSIDRNDRIVSINGQKISEIIKKLLRYVPSDGYNTTRKYHLLSKDFYRYYYLFQDQSESFDVEIENDNLNTFYKVGGVPISAFNNNNEEPQLDFEILNAELAAFTIRTFHNPTLEKFNINFSKFVDSVFVQLKEQRIETLILDLRNNQGGSDGNGNLLYSYLAREPFEYYKRIEVANTTISFEEYLSASGREEWNQVKKYFDMFAKPNEYGTFNFDRKPLLSSQLPIEPKPNAFRGKLFVLINGGTFSAAAEIASFIHYRKRGEFVGEEAGGNYNFNVSGFTPTLVLPNSQIRVAVPTLKYEMDVSDYTAGHGVIPEHPLSDASNANIRELDIFKLDKR